MINKTTSGDAIPAPNGGACRRQALDEKFTEHQLHCKAQLLLLPVRACVRLIQRHCMHQPPWPYTLKVGIFVLQAVNSRHTLALYAEQATWVIGVKYHCMLQEACKLGALSLP